MWLERNIDKESYYEKEPTTATHTAHDGSQLRTRSGDPRGEPRGGEAAQQGRDEVREDTTRLRSVCLRHCHRELRVCVHQRGQVAHPHTPSIGIVWMHSARISLGAHITRRQGHHQGDLQRQGQAPWCVPQEYHHTQQRQADSRASLHRRRDDRLYSRGADTGRVGL